MTNIQRYHTQDLGTLVDKIMKNSVGMDDYFNQFFDFDATTNYPPYNLIQLNNVDSRLEIALAGFSKDEVKVYAQSKWNKDTFDEQDYADAACIALYGLRKEKEAENAST